MADPVLGLLFAAGACCAALWSGYRALNARRAYGSVDGSDVGPRPPLVKGDEVTVEGEVIVDDPVTVGGDDFVLEDSGRSVALLCWRIRHGAYDDDLTTVASGIEAGTFRVDDGTNVVAVDPDQLTDRYGATTLHSLERSDLESSGPWSKWAWTCPYVYVKNNGGDCTLAEMDLLSPDLHAELGDEQREYSVELAAVPEGESLTVHGEVTLNRGVPVLHGTDDVLLSISDRGPEELIQHLQLQTLKSASYTIVYLLVTISITYAAFTI